MMDCEDINYILYQSDLKGIDQIVTLLLSKESIHGDVKHIPTQS